MTNDSITKAEALTAKLSSLGILPFPLARGFENKDSLDSLSTQQ